MLKLMTTILDPVSSSQYPVSSIRYPVSRIQYPALRSIVVFLLGILIVAVPRIANAHKVSVFAWVEGDTVYFQSKISGGRKPKCAPVEVFNARGDLILSGVTNDNGEFSFKVEEKNKTEMKIVLLVGMGHRAEWTIPAGDFESGETKSMQEAAPLRKTPGKTDTSLQSKEPGPNTGPALRMESSDGLTVDDVQTMIEKTLDRKLKPVMKMLAESREKDPSLRDILGGIGYILGLVGIAMYFRYRRKEITTESTEHTEDLYK